jgi:hypothetical protein
MLNVYYLNSNYYYYLRNICYLLSINNFMGFFTCMKMHQQIFIQIYHFSINIIFVLFVFFHPASTIKEKLQIEPILIFFRFILSCFFLEVSI